MSYIQDYTNTYVINNKEYVVTAPAKFDDKTHKLIPDKKLDEAAAEKARAMYRKDQGLFSPADLKEYRKKLSLSQRDFAELTGLSPNAVAMYEAGAFPTVTNNRLIKALIKDDRVLKDYLEENQSQYSEKLKTTLHNYFYGKPEQLSAKIDPAVPKYDSLAVANWFIADDYFRSQDDCNVEPLTQMKLVKYLYFAYGRFLAKFKRQLFASKIVALPYGPVVEQVHQKYDGLTTLPEPNNQTFHDYNEISKNAELFALLNSVAEDYSKYSASGLSKITHQVNLPWSLTKKGKPINDQLILDCFSSGNEK